MKYTLASYFLPCVHVMTRAGAPRVNRHDYNMLRDGVTGWDGYGTESERLCAKQNNCTAGSNDSEQPCVWLKELVGSSA
jgi:hypothetical protein